MTEGPETTTATATDPTVLANVAERLTFFFSHANVRSDRFLQKIMARDDDFGASVGADILLKFKSIQQYTNEASVICEAAQTLDFLTVTEQTISATEPMKKSQLDDNIPLSLHVEGLPLSEDDSKYSVTVADLKPLFEEHGSVALIKLKWKPSGTTTASSKDGDNNKKRKMVPQGACLVEYTKLEDAEKAATAMIGDDDKKTIIQDATLKILKLADWIAARKAAKPHKTEQDANNNNKDANKDNKRKADAPPVKEFTLDWKKGCVIELKGLDKDACDREAICAVAVEVGSLEGVYADYSRGQTDGAIRCPEPTEKIAAFCAKLAAGDVEIAGKKVESAKVLEGEEEEAYWNKFIEFKNKQIRDKANNNRFKSNKRGRRR